MADNGRPQADREAQAKLAQKKVQAVEKHLGQICECMGSIARKNARLRDKGDLLARNVIAFAEADEFNTTTRRGLLEFAENYAAVQDYNHAHVQRLEAKVLKPLMRYGELCRFVKRCIKQELTACGKEKKVLQKMEKARQKSDNNQQIVATELDRIQGEEQVVGEAMEMEMDKFEMEKLVDVKKVFTEMVKIEMMYHAKALEFLSRCFEKVQQIDIEADLDEFRVAMRRASTGKESGTMRRESDHGRMRIDASTLTSTGSTRRSSDTMTSGTLTSSGTSTLRQTPRQMQRVRISSPMYQDADDEDSEEEDEDD